MVLAHAHGSYPAAAGRNDTHYSYVITAAAQHRATQCRSLSDCRRGTRSAGARPDYGPYYPREARCLRRCHAAFFHRPENASAQTGRKLACCPDRHPATNRRQPCAGLGNRLVSGLAIGQAGIDRLRDQPLQHGTGTELSAKSGGAGQPCGSECAGGIADAGSGRDSHAAADRHVW